MRGERKRATMKGDKKGEKLFVRKVVCKGHMVESLSAGNVIYLSSTFSLVIGQVQITGTNII